MRWLFGIAAVSITVASFFVIAASSAYLYDRYEHAQALARARKAAEDARADALINQTMQRACKKLGDEYEYRRDMAKCCALRSNYCRELN